MVPCWRTLAVPSNQRRALSVKILVANEITTVGEALPQIADRSLHLFEPAVGPCVDPDDAERGADQRELLGAVVGPVLDIQALRHAAADQRLLEHRQEGDGVLGARERYHATNRVGKTMTGFQYPPPEKRRPAPG